MKLNRLARKIFSALRILGVAVFVYILFTFDLSAIANVLRKADLLDLFLGILFQLAVLLAKGVRWHLMNCGRPEGKYWALSLGRFFESYAIGIVTPGRVGEVMKAGYEKGKSNMLTTAVRVVAERGIDIGLFCALAGLSIAFGSYFGMSEAVALIIAASGVAIALLGIVLVTFPEIAFRFVNNVKKIDKTNRFMIIPDSNFKQFQVTNIIFLSFLSNFSYFISCYFLGKSVGINAGFIWVAGAVAISGLLNMLPVSVMGLGTRDLVFLFVFKSIAVESVILAFSFLVVLVAQMCGGLVSLIVGQCLLMRSRKFEYE